MPLYFYESLAIRCRATQLSWHRADALTNPAGRIAFSLSQLKKKNISIFQLEYGFSVETVTHNP